VSAGGFAAFVLAFLWFIGAIGGNFREVDPGRFYRSAQLTGGNLRGALAAGHIKSVINLRGGKPGDREYDDEIAMCGTLGIQHVDVPLSAVHLPPPDKMIALLAALDRLPRPVLVHCRGGSDRSGLVSALYLNVYRAVPLDQAVSEELTWRYGHFGFTQSGAMDRFFELYRKTAGGMSLREWIRVKYPTVYARDNHNDG
jgi:protein tyrosine/serine phosphatase